jgi:8-oxo-dGTP diphosphatase
MKTVPHIPDDPGRRGAVAIVVRHGRMLVIRRSHTVVAPLFYCFPGGGIENGETDEEALIREFREEVGVTIQIVRKIWQCTTAWKVQLSWWSAVIDPEAVPVANLDEVESIHWFTPGEMAELPDLLDSNRQFLDLVQKGEIRLG